MRAPGHQEAKVEPGRLVREARTQDTSLQGSGQKDHLERPESLSPCTGPVATTIGAGELTAAAARSKMTSVGC